MIGRGNLKNEKSNTQQIPKVNKKIKKIKLSE
jgi:hypothetical protein